MLEKHSAGDSKVQTELSSLDLYLGALLHTPGHFLHIVGHSEAPKIEVGVLEILRGRGRS